MKKTYKLEELDCPNCAAKMQDTIAKLDGVAAVSVNFIAQRLTLEADDANFNDILKNVQKIMRRVEPDCRIVM
ncbi:MAG: heavy-metal-associated domain-containing protein [Eubacteriales bacterium]